jgi:hypothetical protein
VQHSSVVRSHHSLGEASPGESLSGQLEASHPGCECPFEVALIFGGPGYAGGEATYWLSPDRLSGIAHLILPFFPLSESWLCFA